MTNKEEVWQLANMASNAPNNDECDRAITGLRELGQSALDILDQPSEDASHPRDYSWLKSALILNYLGEKKGGDVLIKTATESESDYIRHQALIYLCLAEEKEGQGRFVEPLLKVLREDKNPNIRTDVALALAFLKGEPRIIKALIEALKDDEQLFQNLEEKEYRMNTDVRDAAALSLTRIKPTDDIALSAAFAHILLVWRKQVIAEVVKNVGKPAVKHLIENLGNENKEIRKNSIIGLGEVADLEGLKPLSDMLDHVSYDVRNEAVTALRKLGNPAQESLIKALNDKESPIRQSAAVGLKNVGDERALEALTRAKEDKSWWVRGAAKGAINNISKRLKKK